MIKSKVAKFGAAAALALGLAVSFQPGASAAAAITVTPSTGLAAEAVVTVSASGLNPNTIYYIGQCTYTETNDIACNQSASLQATSDAGGKLTANLTVQKTFQGLLGATGQPWRTVRCGVDACYVGLGDSTGHGGSASISFR